MEFECSFWMLRPPAFGKPMLWKGLNNMGYLWQPLNPTLELLLNIGFPKASGLSIQKLHSKSIYLSELLNLEIPVAG